MSNGHWPEPVRPYGFKRGDAIIHYKGGEYYIVGTPTEFVIEATRERAYAYRAFGYITSPTIIRSQKEMEDGRFVLKGQVFQGQWAEKAKEY